MVRALTTVLILLTLGSAAPAAGPALEHVTEAAKAAYSRDRVRVAESSARRERQDIARHVIEIDVDPETRSLAATDRITLTLDGRRAALALDRALDVEAVLDGDGGALRFSREDDMLRVVVPGEGVREATLVIEYAGRGLAAGHPGSSSSFFLLTATQDWYPNAVGFDPANLRITVRYPAGLASVCTGALSGMLPSGETTEQYPVGDVWDVATSIPSAALLVADIESEWGFRGDASVSLHRPTDEETGTSVTIRDVRDLIRFLESCYGDYPFDWLHVVRTGPGAGPAQPVHGPGLVVLPSPASSQTTVMARLAASLSRSWWSWSVDAGPLVSDGLSGHAEFMWLRAAGAEEEVRRRRELRRYQYVRALIESGGTLPLTLCLGDDPLDDPRLSKGKGSSLFEILEFVVGSEAFCGGLRQVSDEWRGMPVPFGQVIGAIEERAGEDLDWFVYDWVVRGDLPTYSLAFDVEKRGDGQYAIRGVIRQDGEAYRTPLPLTVDLGGWAYQEWIPIESADQTFELITESEPLELKVDATRIIPTVDPVERARSHFELGKAAAARNEWGRAVNELGAAARLVSDRPAYWFEYGQALVRSGRVDPGIEAMERAVSASNEQTYYRSFLTRIYLTTGRYHEALESAALLLEEHPGDFQYLSDRAIALVGLGRLDEAGAVLERARRRLDETEVPPATAERFYVAVGVYHEAAGALDEAEAAYSYVLTISPLSDEARRGIERVRRLRSD
ncbi:MAG: hypothetical protein GF405_10835 [Candidatus Eisenbacteria bacterium]|nr:hypothetical protein [Candidatus Eisenbacteria bacterium]